MKTDFKVLLYSMVNNFIIAVLKVFGGIFFNLSSLMADGLHTFSDFITDIVSLVGAKISKKRPTKYHPFGFGKVEYLANLFIGVILFSLGVFIIVNGFGKEHVIPPLSLLWILFITLILKIITIIVMNRIGKRINSQMLITSVKESKVDLYSSAGVIVITILLQFSDKLTILRYIDLVGSILIGLIVMKTAFEIVADNSMSLIGEIEEDKKIIEEVRKFVLENKSVEKADVSLIMYGSYYKLQLSLELDSNLTLNQVTKLEEKIKKDIIRHRSFKIKYVTIYVTNDLD